LKPVRNADFAKEVETILQQIIETDCVRITKENHAKAKNIFKQFARWASYQFIRLLVYLFTFYFKHKG
jgi:cardiolipin synthase A/B